MAKENISIKTMITPVLDQRATTNVIRDLEKIAKKGSAVNFTKTIKQANLNVKAINEISKAAEAFSKNLSSAANASLGKLKELGKKLSEAKQEAKALESAYAAESDDTKKGDIQKKLSDLSSVMGDLNKQINAQKGTLKSYTSEIKRASVAQKKGIDKLNEMASFSGKDMFKGVGDGLIRAVSGDIKGGLAGMLSSISKGAAGKTARGVQEKGDAAGGAKGAEKMAGAGEMMGKAATGLSMAVAGLAALAKFINKASGAMADLNKKMLEGTGFAKDIGVSGADYAKSLKNMREAAMDAHGALIKFGGSSETAMAAAGAFARESTGSIVQAEAMIKDMGGKDLQQGMFELAKNAQVYGKALGMEATEVAGFMGQMVSEIGISHQNVSKVMADVVKQASQAGIPVNKFMAIFKDAIPELDMFTNRIEEVTGVVKMMSKTMDPRQLKDFMKAFGKGFDQMDFKQRLKMVLVVGPGKMGKIMEKDFARSTESMAGQLGDLGDEFKQAMSGKGPTKDITKDIAAISAKAAAAGIDPTKISAMQDLARSKKLGASGDPLKMATGMKGMGMLGRMEALEAHAGAFTGGDLTGLGEHVAKQLGISEQELKAIQKLKDNMAVNTASVRKTGRTSSVSINTNLKKILKQEGKLKDDSDETFESTMKGLTDGDIQEKIKLASTMQMAEDKENAQSADEIAQQQVIATTSLGDKMENVLAFLLEKIYYAMDSVLSELNGIFSWMSGGEAEKKSVAAINAMRDDAKKSFAGNDAAYAKFSGDMDAVQRAVASGKDSKDLANQFGDKLMGLGFGKVTDAKTGERHWDWEKETKVRGQMATAGLSREDIDKFVNSYKEGKIVETDKLLKGMDTDKMVKLLGELSKDQATDAKGLGRGTAANEAGVLHAKQRTGGTDLDKRTADLYGKGVGDAAAAKIAQETGQPAPPKSGAAVPKPGDPGFIGPPAPPKAGLTPEQVAAIKKVAADAAAGPAATIGAPAAGPGPGPGPKPADVKLANVAAQDSTKIQEEHAKTADAALSQDEDIYRGINDTLSLFKKGIKYEQSWLTTKYSNVLKDATLESFRTALFEFAMLTEWDKVSQWGKDLGEKNMKPSSGSDFLKQTGKWAQEVSPAKYGFATGGSVDYDQMARVHKGEMVVPKGGMLVKGGEGSGGKIVNVNATINVQTDADPKQIAAAVHELYRAH